MTRRAARIIRVLTGLCLAAGAIASVIILVGDAERTWQHNLRELSPLVDVLALLLWIGIFAIYWAGRQRNKQREFETHEGVPRHRLMRLAWRGGAR